MEKNLVFGKDDEETTAEERKKRRKDVCQDRGWHEADKAFFGKEKKRSDRKVLRHTRQKRKVARKASFGSLPEAR